MIDADELYVMARRVLLDALGAIGSHRDAVVLVGAQAVYLRVGEGDLAVAPFTIDGDLAIDPSLLSDIPPLEQALMSAGFHAKTKDSVGIWIANRRTRLQVNTEVAIDLLVPESVSSGGGRRAARLAGHDARAARIVRGLEGAVVDADVMTLRALDVTDSRAVDIRVAGPAALLVAKVHKISERQGTSRLSDKDALDVVRLLRGTQTDELAARFERLVADPRSAAIARAGRDLFAQQFTRRGSVGVQMAIRAAAPLADPDELAASCAALSSDLLAAT